MEITRLKFAKNKLASMPSKDRTLLLLLGHVNNEIIVLQKLMILCGKSNHSLRLVRIVEDGQNLILLRLLVGKLHEAWECFQTRVLRDQEMSSKYLPLPLGQGAEELASLKKHFGQRSLLSSIRNKLSFHYADQDELIEKNYSKLDDSEPWEFFLGQTRGNTFYYASEMVVTAASISLASSQEDIWQKADLKKVLDTSYHVASEIAQLFDYFTVHILDRELPDFETSVIDIGPATRASDIPIPFFLDEADLQRDS